MSNLDQLAKAGVPIKDMSAEEKQVVESLSQPELSVLLEVRTKYEGVCKGNRPVTSLKIL
ncbi:MAG: aroma-sacti cluster domain-containing protein [Candidatus Acidiferrales bacterium]